ncbi:chemosensory receptor a [Plakobranchus ocellatus]|uniref:Chemosensory receptor a n=1 Tax=Plakobranchus ocellatus TaxID=259542 RepID=A0AAV3Z9T3_9GAST|nr:chemosensory receptor a [Plakobranchus ocellatus]
MAQNVIFNATLSSQTSVPHRFESYLVLTALLPTWPAIIVFGLLANVLNIVSFLKAGIRDSVTTLLFSLAVSDVFFLLLISPTAATYIIFHFQPKWDWPFDRNLPFFLLYWPAYTLYDFSAYISVSTGVIRCACVAMPLRFKSVFTKSRTVKLLVVLFVVTVLLRMPVLTMVRIGWRFNPATNSSEPYVQSYNRETLTQINDILYRNSLPYINFIIMIACVIILATKLYEATRVRRSHTAHSHTDETDKHLADKNKVDAGRLSPKDIQVVQSVVLVCSIFIISQLPFLLYSTARLIQPEFNDKGYYRHLFRACSTISFTCSFLNASVNIFVYYRYNSKYRLAFLSIFNKRAASRQMEGKQ